MELKLLPLRGVGNVAPVGWWPARACPCGRRLCGSRSTDYTFGIVILDLKKNKKGKEEGVGQLIYAAKVKVDGRTVEVENYGIEPARLQGVRRQK